MRCSCVPDFRTSGSEFVSACAAALVAGAVAVLATACASPAPPEARDGPARRIVSLDYCADQYVLGLAERSRILALSPDAGEAFSYLRAAAAGLPAVRPRAEDVLALRPDLVVRSYGGGPRAQAFFERSGVPVLQLDYAPDISAVRDGIRKAAAELGVPARGEAVIAEMDTRLERVRAERTRAGGTRAGGTRAGGTRAGGTRAGGTRAEGTRTGGTRVEGTRAGGTPAGGTRAGGTRPRALYLTPAGVSAGAGTFVHDLIGAAGLGNFDDRSGWRSIPLERLAYEAPEVYAVPSFGATNHENAWTPFRHPVATERVAAGPLLGIDGATTACGGWFLADAVEVLATGAADAAGAGAGPALRP